MARRVAIARAFAVAPALVLLDEPFASLDAATAETCRMALLAAWRHRPGAVLLVTHDLAEAASLADRIVLLTAGPARIADVVDIPRGSRRQGIAEGELVAAALRAQGRL
jgi:ABC-type nitrate/sulfonate/bicarbonate transport system ATPase subunit